MAAEPGGWADFVIIDRDPAQVDPREVELARLRRENERLQTRLAQAETIIEVQKKLSQLLGVPLTPEGDESA